MPTMTAFRPVVAGDIDALLALNTAHAVETNLLTREKFAHMVDEAFAARTNDSHAALLIAFDQDGDYDSVNFKWFRERLGRFVYVDRIIVASSERGKGIARALYAELFAQARAAGHRTIALEINRVPPNPGSDAFHAALGFAEFGRGSPYPGKEVRYLTRDIA